MKHWNNDSLYLLSLPALLACGLSGCACPERVGPSHAEDRHDHAEHRREHAEHDDNDPEHTRDHAWRSRDDDEHTRDYTDSDHKHSPGPMGHRFERADEWVARFDDPKRDLWQKPADVIAAMDIAPGMVVADVGSGTGYFLPHLVRACGPSGKVLALDIEPDMVRYLGERATREKLANVEPRLVQPDDPKLADASVDRVLVVDTWHHIPPDRSAYAAKLARSLRPGGALVIVDFTLDAERGPPREHRLAPEAIVKELAAAGLVAEVRTDVLPDQYIVIARPAGAR